MASCTSCGYTTGRWMGFCPQCRSSGTLSEGDAAAAVPITRLADLPETRITTGVAEFDRVLGGGIVVGSVALLAGEPGVGKSTLVLGIAAAMERNTLIVSGEESVGQIKMRAGRIGALVDTISVAAASDAETIVAMIESGHYDLAVIDSIQTVSMPATATGSATQVKEATSMLVTAAKNSGTALLLTGHVTKEGSIAGPKLLEHMVDVVITMEGDPHRGVRFVRCAKNRYGSVDDVGIFEMTTGGLAPVPDASASLIAGRDPQAPGSVLFPTIDGMRSLVVEIQSLVVPSSHAQPRRSVKGLPSARVHQILATLERHAGVALGRFEVYVSAVGGLRITEPAADLAVALAVASAASGVAVSDVAAWGEVGLTGELRAVPHAGRRRIEAERIGVGGLIDGSSHGQVLDALIEAGLAAATVMGDRVAAASETP